MNLLTSNLGVLGKSAFEFPKNVLLPHETYFNVLQVCFPTC